MKKTRYLALVLVVAIMMMGAGYAYWTDTLVVNSTVNTGYLDVDFTKIETPKTFPVIGYTDPQDVTIKSNIKALGDEGENGLDRDLIEFELIDFYPAAKVRRYITLENVGTLEVKIKKSDVKFIDGIVDPALKPYMKVSANRFAILYPYSEGEVATLETSIEPAFVDFGLFDYIKLKKGETCILEVEFELDKAAPNNTEVKSATYSMTLNVEQFNK